MNKTNRLIQLFILLMVMLALPVMQASAALTRCRIDPHFKLSNGDMVTVTLDIGTDIANVKSVNYILHVPAGVTVTNVTYTAKSDRKAITETYTVIQDSKAKTYTADTVVTTRTPGRVDVIVYTRVNALKEIAVAGYSSQLLSATFFKP